MAGTGRSENCNDDNLHQRKEVDMLQILTKRLNDDGAVENLTICGRNRGGGAGSALCRRVRSQSTEIIDLERIFKSTGLKLLTAS